ncbi:MAG: hypothetical protein LBQ60_02200, partial [Bacteroidales bacterium]|nr:hypothetical protein [Bacteroidales bacterium]
MNHLFTKTFLSIIFISVLFTSCTDNDYDTDDLNKDAVWSPGGVSLPIGNLKSITLLDELNGLINDPSDPIKIAADGSLYLSYSGDLSFNVPEVEPLEDAEEPIAQVSVSTFGLVTNHPYSDQEIEIAPHTSSSINYEFADPVYSGDDWEIDVDSIGLDNCPLTAELELYGITFNDRGTPTYLEIVVTIPAAFTLPDNTNRVVTKNVNMSDFVNGKYNLQLADIIGYKYRNEIELNYGVKIHTGSNTSVTTTSNSFTFDMNFVSCNINMTVIKGKIKIDQNIEGSNTKISSFGKTFANDILIVDNPSLRIDVTTNFGFDFDLTMDQLTAKKDGEAPVIINNTVPMSFTKPANFPDIKTTSYLYAVKNDGSVNNNFFIPMNIGSLIDTKPNEISYNIVGNTEEENAYIVPHNMILDAKYDVIVPFGFKQMSLNIDKTLENIFDEDVVDRFFKEG